MVSSFPVTGVGYSALQDELKHRTSVERPRLLQRIQQAISDDVNLAENSEFQAVKAEQEANELRITELQDKLARVEVIDISKLSGDSVAFGATVTLIDEDTKQTLVWQIVGEPEADVARGKLSISSPIARALLGKHKGFTQEVMTPAALKTYRIKNVEWLEQHGKI